MAEREAHLKAATDYSNIAGYYKKSAEVIVVKGNELRREKKNGEVSRQHEGLNVRIGINIRRTYEAKKKKESRNT